jgi:hypothetical protein
MINQPSIRSAPNDANEHADFLSLVPVIEKQARIAFRDRNATDREEAVAEAVATAFTAYVRLKARGKDPVRDFPSSLASFAVLHVKDGRHVGGRSSSTDVLSCKARQLHGFKVDLLPTSGTPQACIHPKRNSRCGSDALNDWLQENRRTPVPDQVAFRIDFPQFLRGLSLRDRELARFLGQGHTAMEAASRFKLSPGRITQLRQRWRRDWLLCQGEYVAAQVATPATHV